MAIVKVKVSIKGISPLLMHKFPECQIENVEKKSKEEQAEYAAYRELATKELYIPALCIQRALVNGATFSKGKRGSTKSKEVAACVQISPEVINLGVKNYVIDSRPVVIKATKGRIVRHRPRLDEWSCKFAVEYDDTLLKNEELKRIFDDTGIRVGLLDFRPQCKGMFGRFIVTEWK